MQAFIDCGIHGQCTLGRRLNGAGGKYYNIRLVPHDALHARTAVQVSLVAGLRLPTLDASFGKYLTADFIYLVFPFSNGII